MDLGIGGNHFIHTMRRNVDLLYIVMGQPDLRAHHSEILADQPHRHEDQKHALRQHRDPGQSHFTCACRRQHELSQADKKKKKKKTYC